MPRALKIGPLELSPGLLLAPMEKVTDLPFRAICKRLGADMVYTEFINAEGLRREGERGPGRARAKLNFLEEERPIGIQIYGDSEGSMEQAARIAAACGPDLIDINCGCWVSNVALRGAGAGLLREPDRMRRVAARVVGATRLPVTVKTRLGWDAQSIRIVEVARMLEEVGVQALSLHCRTRAQGHQGKVDYAWIGRVKEAVSIPVILNGDVNTAQEVARAFARTGCDGVMIGRGALRHPWIFSEARHLLERGALPPPPSLEARARLCLEHLRLAVEYKDEGAALRALRRHYKGYFRGLAGAAQLRDELAQYREVGALEERLQTLGEARAPRAASRSCE